MFVMKPENKEKKRESELGYVENWEERKVLKDTVVLLLTKKRFCPKLSSFTPDLWQESEISFLLPIYLMHDLWGY